MWFGLWSRSMSGNKETILVTNMEITKVVYRNSQKNTNPICTKELSLPNYKE